MKEITFETVTEKERKNIEQCMKYFQIQWGLETGIQMLL